MSQGPAGGGHPRRAWLPVLIIVLIVALAIAGALVLRSRWLSREPRATGPLVAGVEARHA